YHQTCCFLSLQIDGKLMDNVVFELFYSQAPNACCRSICSSSKGFNFEGCIFNYLHVNCYLEGGETTVYTNDGERYVNEVAKIDDERMPHNKPGLLSMPVHDLSIKFLITLCPMPSLNESHVVIGRLIEGMGLIEAINKKSIKNSGGIECDRGLPLANVTIYSCGETNNTLSY
ncbi:unnamed protein product, partial [Rotaria magnacalcarata]